MLTSNTEDSTWWGKLSLTLFLNMNSMRGSAAHKAVVELLKKYEPASFVNYATGANLTISEIEALIEATARTAEEEARVKRQAEKAARLKNGWRRINDALNAPDGAEQVTEGEWAGFTRGEARAWFFNLYDYEPIAKRPMAVSVQAKAIEELENGGLPEVLGYAARAKELANRGLTVQDYRKYRELLKPQNPFL